MVPLRNTSAVIITQSGRTSHLTLINVTLADHGNYKCVATSSIGEDFKDAELVVKSKLLLLLASFGYNLFGMYNLLCNFVVTQVAPKRL